MQMTAAAYKQTCSTNQLAWFEDQQPPCIQSASSWWIMKTLSVYDDDDDSKLSNNLLAVNNKLSKMEQGHSVGILPWFL